jgi:hypothetical protein
MTCFDNEAANCNKLNLPSLFVLSQELHRNRDSTLENIIVNKNGLFWGRSSKFQQTKFAVTTCSVPSAR